MISLETGTLIQLSGKNTFCKKKGDTIILILETTGGTIRCFGNVELYEIAKTTDPENTTVYGTVVKNEYPLRYSYADHSIAITNITGPACERQFNIWRYKGAKHEHVFASYGAHKGNFCFPDKELLYKFLLDQEASQKFKFLDCVTEYYKLYFDIDYKDKLSVIIDREDLMNAVISAICETVQCLLTDQCTFVRCEKISGTGGVHLYFPNIVTDKKHAKYFVEGARQLLGEARPDLVPYLSQIIDYSYGGICTLYSGTDCYVVVHTKSTYKFAEPENRLEHLRVTSLKTSDTMVNFTPII